MIRKLLYGDHNPYSGWSIPEVDTNPSSYIKGNSDHPIFRQVLEKLRPNLILEVGTFYGASAIHMAKTSKELNLNVEIVCIDTFLGSSENWSQKVATDMRLKGGRPQFYEKFIENVIRSGVADIITPCPMTTSCASEVLKYYNVLADMIYVDAAHDYRSVREDLEDYWPLLRAGGIMVGDDYDPYWPGVVQAVNSFFGNVSTYQAKWMVIKDRPVWTTL